MTIQLPSSQNTNTAPKPEKKSSYNDILAQKGRASVIASTVLILSSQGYIALDKLPFIGVTIEPSKGAPLCILLVISACYFWYRYSTYKKVVELDSKVDELSIIYAKRFLNWKAARVVRSAKKHVLKHGDLKSHPYITISPADDYSAKEKPYSPHVMWSIFHLVSWESLSSNFDKFSWSKPENIAIEKKTKPSTKLQYQSSCVFADNNGKSMNHSMSHLMELSYAENTRLERVCKLAARLRLPDFLEMAFPSLMFAIAIISSLVSLISG